MEVLAFNRWSTKDLKVEDQGLQRYVSVEPRVIPKTGARYAGNRFHKSKTFIVERLINKVMIPGHIKKHKHYRTSGYCTGKALTAMNAVRDALALIEKKSSQNPLKVLVKAVENAAPREEIITIEYGGARYPKAVDCAPQRRVDIALRHFVWGAYGQCFNKKKSLVEALADELYAAFQCDGKSFAVNKKNDLERQSDASR
ncbi:30S ribosomal protein S7 [Candidatus Woesearchaeota archaeon]|nr:30S ribosomal protein S7 [Candidatus Woesearchaeota archaeon]